MHYKIYVALLVPKARFLYLYRSQVVEIIFHNTTPPPAPSRKNGLRYENFAIEWSSYIEQFVEVREELLIVGDF